MEKNLSSSFFPFFDDSDDKHHEKGTTKKEKWKEISPSDAKSTANLSNDETSSKASE